MKISYEEGKIHLKYFVTIEVYQFTVLPNYQEVHKNAITSDLHRVAHIASNPITKVPIIKCKFKTAGYPDRFITVS